jgi:hypothetical protein
MAILSSDESGANATTPMSSTAHQIPAAAAPAQKSFSQPAGQQQQFSQARNMNKTPSLLAMTGRIPSPLAAAPEAESLKTFMDTIKEVTQSNSDEYDLSLLPINGKDNSLILSVLVLVIRLKSAGQPENERGLSYHTLLLADTMGNAPAATLSIQGQNVTVPRPPGDAYDDKMRNVILERLQREYRNVSPNNMFEAEAEVIPRGYAYKNADQVRRTILNALKAAATALVTATVPDLQDIVLDGNARNLNLQVRVSTRQNQIVDEVGDVVRTDIRIDLTEGKAQQAQQVTNVIPSLNNGEQVSELLSIGAFIDLSYEPAVGAVQNNPYAPVMQAQLGQAIGRQLYRPRLVITHFETTEMRTLPGQLLALATVPALTEGFAWFSQFTPVKGTQFDMHDIGAIGYEANPTNNPSGIGDRFDTRANTFTDTNLAQLLHAYVLPDMFISMDVEECGPSTYWNSVFLAAASGSLEANKAIFYAADVLTNGNFSKLHNMTGPAVLNDQNRIHLGDYTDKSGNKRDIRDVDYLAILNTFGANDMVAVQGWSDSYNRVEFPMELRMDARFRLIEQAIGSSVNLKGFARRVTFHTENFLVPFLQAVKATGLTMRPQTPFQDVSGQPRATAGYLQQAGLSSAVSGLYSRGYGTQNNPGVSMQGGFGRWRG